MIHKRLLDDTLNPKLLLFYLGTNRLPQHVFSHCQYRRIYSPSRCRQGLPHGPLVP
jgi:hypothetical protein